ncbi:MAG: hypothetical protein KAH20_12685 [Methylococcales bacterium]|nr:hypothetical protein [Methylococcales bacterium]
MLKTPNSHLLPTEKSSTHPSWAYDFKFKHLLFIAILFISMAFLGYLSSLALLKIDLDSSTKSDLEIYWTDESKPFSQEKSKVTPTIIGRKSYWFIINDFKRFTYFRIDPAKEKTNIKLHGVKLFSIQHFPVNINLFNDSESKKEIKDLVPSTHMNSYSEFITQGEDSQIEIKPILVRSHLVSILFLILIIGLLFPKKYYLQAFLLFGTATFLYFCLSLNETVISFRVQATQAGQVKVFWRDEFESFSTTKVRTVEIKPETQHYQVNIRNISNIEELYLDIGKNKEFFTIDELQIKETGFENFNFTGTKSILDKHGRSNELLISITLFLFVCLLILWVIFYYPKNKNHFYFKVFPKLIRVLFIFSSLLVFNLAWESNFNIHPDEHAHIASVEYFSHYWDPPKIGDIRSIDTYQLPWATSRLDDLGISYFIAGKFRNLVQVLFTNEVFIARAFNAFLFMLFFVLSTNKRLLLFLTPLLCTPQIWYLYAYTNRGGFVLFISLLLAWQLVNKKSSLNIFLRENQPLSNWKTILFPGLLLGLLSIEQTNYLLFILFVFSFLFWQLLFFVKNKKVFIYKCLLFMIMAISIYGVRYGIDVSINGFDKLDQRIAYAEEHAGENFKPSIAETKDSYSGLRLKAKGVGFTEIFNPEWDWHKMSFKSFVGFYGYYAEYSPKWYYSYILVIYAILFLVMLRHAIFQATWQYKLFSLLSFTAICGGLLMGMLFCWLYDFQPQGRYVFPIIPIMLVYFWTMFSFWNRHEKAIILTCVLVLALLSFYSFNEVALNYLIS